MMRIAPPPSAALPALSPAGNSWSEAPAGLERKRMLIIEDEPSVAAVLRRQFSSDYEVRVATDALIAMEWLRRGAPFDLVFCDLCLPNFSGLDFYWALATLAPALASRLVLMSGGNFTEDCVATIRGLDIPLLLKPFSRADLALVVRRLDPVLDEPINKRQPLKMAL